MAFLKIGLWILVLFGVEKPTALSEFFKKMLPLIRPVLQRTKGTIFHPKVGHSTLHFLITSEPGFLIHMNAIKSLPHGQQRGGPSALSSKGEAGLCNHKSTNYKRLFRKGSAKIQMKEATVFTQ